MNLAEIDDTHLVAQLLLFCLRERFEPLFSWELHDRVLAIGDEISVSSVQSVVLDLPQANRAQLGRIVELLSQVVESASRNESTGTIRAARGTQPLSQRISRRIERVVHRIAVDGSCGCNARHEGEKSKRGLHL